MLELFLAHAPGVAATALAEDLARMIGALREHDPESYPISLLRGDPTLAADAEIVFVLITRDAETGGLADPGLRETLARARTAGRRMIPIVADDLPGFMEDLGLGEARYRAIPEGGAGIDQLPFDGARHVWLAAVGGAVRLAIEQALRAGQTPGLDLAATAAACRAAVQAVRDAAKAEQSALGSGLPLVIAAADSLEHALAADPIPLLGTPQRLIDEAQAWTDGRAGAERTLAALTEAFIRLYRLGQAGSGAGRPPAPEARAPTRWVKVEAPAGTPDPANADTTLDLANIRSAQRIAAPLLERLRAGSPGDEPIAAGRVQAALRTVAAIEAVAAQGLQPRSTMVLPMADADDAGPGAAARPPRRFGDETWIDISELDASVVPRENALRALAATSQDRLSNATRVLIGEVTAAVRRGLVHVRRVAARAFGRPVPPPPPRTAPGSVWRSRVPGVDPAGWPVMVTLPTGRFQMGSHQSEEGHTDREEPRHGVTIGHIVAFGIAPVTFAQWDAALAARAPIPHPPDEDWGRDARPVMNVSWDDAQAYVGWLNDRLGLVDKPDAYRLPSEAEWEYGCRAGTTTPFSFGETITTDQANFDGTRAYGGTPASNRYLKRTTPVGSFPPNDFGLYDMHGNVWEWCQDTWHDNYRGAPTNGSAWERGDASRRVVRGGSWVVSPRYLRSAARGWDTATDRDNSIGFRLARTLSPATP